MSLLTIIYALLFINVITQSSCRVPSPPASVMHLVLRADEPDASLFFTTSIFESYDRWVIKQWKWSLMKMESKFDHLDREKLGYLDSITTWLLNQDDAEELPPVEKERLRSLKARIRIRMEILNREETEEEQCEIEETE